jgi:MFS family permease
MAPILLLVLRLVQGLAVAGETAGSSVFVAEHVPGSRMGRAAGWLFGSTYLGYFLGAAAGALAANLLSPETLASVGWRVPFILGGVFGFVAVYLRRHLDETPLFEEIRRTKDRARAFPFGDVLREHRAGTIYVVGLAAYLGATITTLYFYLPSFLQRQYALPAPTVFTANTAALLLLALMCPVWGWIADRIGLGRVLAIGAVGIAVLTVGFFLDLDTVAASPGRLLPWYLAFSVAMATVAVIPALASLVFPTEVRFTGFAFGYNVGAALFAGTTPIVLSWIVLTWGKTAMPAYVVAVGVLGVVLGLVTSRLRFYPKPG